MKYFRVTVVLLAVAFAAMSGCSDENTLSPRPNDQPQARRAFQQPKVIGPSEIVFGIDVSDSISTDELSNITSELTLCLGDASLFPADGSVMASIWAFGDTLAPVVENLTPVTPDNVTGIFAPALTALNSDRMVTGAGADLPEFLGAAGDQLALGTTQDPQILVFGSGEVTDAEALDTACTALGEAGVRVSMITLNADETGATLYQSCADATGGYFEDTVGTVEGACGRALMQMLVIDLDLEPETAELNVGDEHTLDAMVYEAGNTENGLSGVTVSIEVVDGPNLGVAGSDTTNVDGVYTFTYTGDGGPGIDTIVASATQPNTGAALTDTVTVTWTMPQLPPECDAGGPYMVDVAADTVTVMLDATGSSDPNGDELSFLWSVGSASGSDGLSFDDPTSATPTLTVWGDALCLDPLMVDLAVMANGDTTMCTAEVHFNELRQAVITAGEPMVLWPPNHKWVTVDPGDLLMAEGGGCNFDWADVSVVEVRCNEPMDVKGAGAHQPDMKIVCPNTVRVRSERSGLGDGRVYTIVYRVTLMDGTTEDLEAEVHVPHDQGHGGSCDEDHGGIGEGQTLTGCTDE